MGAENSMPAGTAMLARPVALQAEDLLSLVGDGIVSTDAHGRIILFNQAAEEMFGLTAAAVMNAPIELLLPDRFHRSHRDLVRDYSLAESLPRTMGDKREVVGRRSDGTEFPVEATLCRRFVAGEVILTVAIRDVTERRALEEQRRLLNAELKHRMKNLMAVIGSVVSLTARASVSVDDFRSGILNRLLAVERSNDLLLAESADGADLRRLLDPELGAYSDSGLNNVVIQGPPVFVPSRLVIALSLIVHELATNAAKHGALGPSNGRVMIKWSVRDQSGRPWLSLHWRETGGTNVTAPTKKGFGTELIEHALCKAIRGRIQADYLKEGLDWRMDLPLI